MSTHKYNDTLGPKNLQIFLQESLFPMLGALLKALAMLSIGTKSPSWFVSWLSLSFHCGLKTQSLQSCYSTHAGFFFRMVQKVKEHPPFTISFLEFL